MTNSPHRPPATRAAQSSPVSRAFEQITCAPARAAAVVNESSWALPAARRRPARAASPPLV
ncbi:hypothetical protein WMF04_20595 [Sorangium sp. So ce260]|uniref:hypothetical protein n=1 Tax=Sorangium sp. So ce260 TaxID=3133291 RepID=UPI003F62A0DE